MSHRVHFVAAVLLIIAVALLCILPAFDVLPTALRSARSAQLVFWALAFWALILVAIIFSSFCYAVVQEPSTIGSSPDVLDSTCALLC